MIIKQAVLDKLAQEQAVIARKSGRESDDMYSALSPEVKVAFKGISREAVACGGTALKDFLEVCGHTIESSPT